MSPKTPSHPSAHASGNSRRAPDPTWRVALPPVASGALIAAGFLDFRLYPLAWCAFVPLLASAAFCRTWRRAAYAGGLAGLATNIPAFHWLVHTIHVFGGFPLPIAVFFYLCLSLYSACQFVLFALGMRLLGPGPLGLAAPVLWVALEFLYPNLFPWRMANTQFHVPVLIQTGDLAGPFGLSFVILWFNAGLASLARRPRRPAPLLTALAALAAVIGYGAARIPMIESAVRSAPRVSLGLVQGNLSIVEKGSLAFFHTNLEKYRRLSTLFEPRVDVLIWPETVSLAWVPTTALQVIEDENPFPGLSTHLLYGGLSYAYREDGSAIKHNSAFLIDPAGRILGRYDKHVLLAFGEYLPGASWLPAIAAFSPQTGDFTPGSKFTTLDVPDRARFGPLICYEDVPAGIARAMTRNGAEVLLTIFNDAWFGRSMAPYQHEALALWRAIENRRYFVRVGNAGATGVIDPLGRIVSRLGLFTAKTLRAEIRPLRMQTFYTRYGNVFAWALTLIAAAWLLLQAATIRHRRSKGSARE